MLLCNGINERAFVMMKARERDICIFEHVRKIEIELFSMEHSNFLFVYSNDVAALLFFNYDALEAKLENLKLQ